MTAPLRVLVVTDSFPPLCGGSGWSTWELVNGLRDMGHTVEVVKIEIARPSGVDTTRVGDLDVTVFRVPSPRVPALRNVIKNERLWTKLARYLEARVRAHPVDVLHAQHVMSTVPTIRAGRAASVPVVATVRDYWPVCYWSDLIFDSRQPRLCPACTSSMMTRCIRPRAGALWPLGLPLIPYMRANLATKQTTLAEASAVIAVSHAIARDLGTRAPALAGTPLHTIPNPVDMQALDAVWASAESPMPGPYVLYAGKLAINKGVQFLLPALERARVSWPLVVVGDGPFRTSFETEARGRGLDVRILGWQAREDVWRWMRHATMLAYPSYGPESLSRVLIEAAALGAPIAAMETGGTADILTGGTSALLSTDEHGFSRDLATLAGDEGLRQGLGRAAREDVRARFAAPTVVRRIADVYRQVTSDRRPA